MLIHEPADWLYDNLTAVPVNEVSPHPLSAYFLKPEESEQKQLQLYMGLQAYVQVYRHRPPIPIHPYAAPAAAAAGLLASLLAAAGGANTAADGAAAAAPSPAAAPAAAPPAIIVVAAAASVS